MLFTFLSMSWYPIYSHTHRGTHTIFTHFPFSRNVSDTHNFAPNCSITHIISHTTTSAHAKAHNEIRIISFTFCNKTCLYSFCTSTIFLFSVPLPPPSCALPAVGKMYQKMHRYMEHGCSYIIQHIHVYRYTRMLQLIELSKGLSCTYAEI